MLLSQVTAAQPPRAALTPRQFFVRLWDKGVQRYALTPLRIDWQAVAKEEEEVEHDAKEVAWAGGALSDGALVSFWPYG
jgi:hypothetical protein